MDTGIVLLAGDPDPRVSAVEASLRSLARSLRGKAATTGSWWVATYANKIENLADQLNYIHGCSTS